MRQYQKFPPTLSVPSPALMILPPITLLKIFPNKPKIPKAPKIPNNL